MYTSFFRLTREPFGIMPDPALLYMTRTHREVLAGLQYAILAQKGLTLLTGDAGTGKTTVISALLKSLPSHVRTFLVLNPVLAADEFLEYLIMQFGVADVPASKARKVCILQELLQQADDAGQWPVLIIDEAHKIAVDVLEEIRLLGNFETTNRRRLQIVLAGQTELRELLNETGLRQLKQRIAVRLSLRTLSPGETSEYISYRWHMSGAPTVHPFSSEAVAAVARYAKGTPRIVNAICDNALVLMLAEERAFVDEPMIHSVCADLDLTAATEDLAAVAAAVEAAPASRLQAPERLVTPAVPASRVHTAPAPARTSISAVASVPASVMRQEAVPVTQDEPDNLPFQTLRRYETAAKQSFFVRCAAMLGFVQ
jgi:general secretion pathway protein A